MVRRVVGRLGVALTVLRVTPAAQVALRMVLLTTGGAALVLAQRTWAMPGLLVVLVGVVALLGAVVAPDNAGPGMVVGAAVLAWLLRWGLDRPPPPMSTVLLAVLLYLFHTTAALLAVLPPGARIAPAVLVRWYSRVLRVLVLAVLLGVAALLLGRVTGGLLVDMLGLVGAVTLVGVPVLVAHRHTGRPGQSPDE